MQTARKIVSIVGAGTQGRRTAYMWSSQGENVCLIDRNEKQLRDAKTYIADLRAADGKVGRQHSVGTIDVCTPEKSESSLANSWLILECIPENLAIKQELVTSLDKQVPQDVIIASNSSSYTIGEIIQDANLAHPERTVSMHSYWPPESPALEIMGNKTTKPSIIELLMAESKRHGFRPFHVRNPDSMGYIYNRIWAAIKREVLLELSEGVATPQEIDEIFKDVLGATKGPCMQMDVVGLDVVLDIEEHYASARTGIPPEPREYLKKMVAEGKLGVKNKRGFYQH